MPSHPTTASILALLLGVPLMISGAVLTATLIGAVVGIPLIILAAMPFKTVQSRYVKRLNDWKFQEHSLNEGQEKPWVL